jgi:hypothetical protein
MERTGYVNRTARWFLLAALGTAVLLLTGSGLVSVLSDSVTSRGNQAESGTLASHDLQVAVGPGCESGPYSDGPTAAVVDADIDLSNVGLLPAFTVCVKNNGIQHGDVVIDFENASDVEVGACTPSEAAEDATCEAAQSGELASVLEVRWIQSPACIGTFPGPQKLFQEYVDESNLLGPLLAGDTCELYFYFNVSADASEAALIAAQTDRLTWDIVFTLQAP